MRCESSQLVVDDDSERQETRFFLPADWKYEKQTHLASFRWYPLDTSKQTLQVTSHLATAGGVAQSFKLLRSTMSQLQAGLALSALPKTIRDAIEISTWLNISYIWIDALCIIQDDPNDWNTEAVTMKDVYSNSFLTIAAHGGKSSAEGCFAERNRLMHVPANYLDQQTESRESSYSQLLDTTKEKRHQCSVTPRSVIGSGLYKNDF